MSGVERFEDLIAWQKARWLTKRIYEVTRELPFSRDFGLCGQIQRASVSVMSNIAEGFERERPKEFFHYLTMAKASCGEVRSELYVALDVGYLAQPRFQQLQADAAEVARIITGLRNAAAQRRSS